MTDAPLRGGDDDEEITDKPLSRQELRKLRKLLKTLSHDVDTLHAIAEQDRRMRWLMGWVRRYAAGIALGLAGIIAFQENIKKFLQSLGFLK